MTTEDTHAASDLELVRRARAGEPSALDRFLDRMKCVHRMLAVKNRSFGRPFEGAELEDLAQEIMIAVWTKLDSYQGLGPLEAWVLRFVHLQVIYRLRGKDNRPVVLADDEVVGSDLRGEPVAMSASQLDDEERTQLYEALELLGPPEADVLRLKHLEGLKLREVAERFGSPLSTIKTQYYRGLSRMRSLLDERRGQATSERKP